MVQSGTKEMDELPKRLLVTNLLVQMVVTWIAFLVVMVGRKHDFSRVEWC